MQMLFVRAHLWNINNTLYSNSRRNIWIEVLKKNWYLETQTTRGCSNSSKHSLNQFVDLVLSVAPDATIVVRMSLLSEALLGRVELEGPEEVVDLLEVGSNGGDFVDKILNAGNTVLLSKDVLNDGVVSQGDSRAVDLSEASLVNELGNGSLRGVAIGDVGLDSSEHVDGGLVKLHEHTVVQLSKSQQLHDLLALGVKLVDTIRSWLLNQISSTHILKVSHIK